MIVRAEREGLLGAGVNAHRIDAGAGECAGFSEGDSPDSRRSCDRGAGNSESEDGRSGSVWTLGSGEKQRT